MTLKPVIASLFMLTLNAHAAIEVSGSPFDTRGAPLPIELNTQHEKAIYVDPIHHFWGAYGANGRLVRWGIATTGADFCRDDQASCRTRVGTFRIYSLGNEHCVSSKYPSPTGGAPMPYCMYFVNGQAIHGSNDVESSNASHGCVRVHTSDAQWLRYHFVEAPTKSNHYEGTRVIIGSYGSAGDDLATTDANF